MGLLSRLIGRHQQAVWRVETTLLDRLGMVRAPAAVQWISTAVCDLHCPHCYSRAGRAAVGELSTEEAKHLLVDERVRLGQTTRFIAISPFTAAPGGLRVWSPPLAR